MAGPGRPGRRKKGDRIAVSIRVERRHRALYAEEAKRLRLPEGDYLAMRLAIDHDLRIPPYISPYGGTTQATLELDFTARDLARPTPVELVEPSRVAGATPWDRYRKGDRAAVSLRAERTHRDLYKARADSYGAPLVDYLAVRLVVIHGLAVPDYLRYLVVDVPEQMEAVARSA